MKHVIFLTFGIAAGLLDWLLSLATGYFVDPAPLWFGGIFFPFFALPLLAIPVLVAIGYCLRLVFVRKTRGNIGLTLAALIGLVIVMFSPRLFNSYDAFVYRMKGFSEADYHRVAADLENLKTDFIERAEDDLPDFYSFRDLELEIPESLIESHPILSVSDFPIDIWARNERVTLEWASGLTGGYVAAISLSSDPPSGWAGGFSEGDCYNPRVTYIYDGVALKRRGTGAQEACVRPNE